ncbi:MAG: GIY-YIG nuclease family protein [bacterium]
MRLPAPVSLDIGALGTHNLPAGHYIYTGSARRGLRARLARHQRQNKTLRWHIDYLLQWAETERIDAFQLDETDECALARQSFTIPGAQIIVRGFGSSDCRCPAHLVWLR